MSKLEGRLPSQLKHDTFWLFKMNDLGNILEREGFEVELVTHVEVGRYRLRVRVDHDRLIASFSQSENRLHAAVVELNALPDSVRSTPEDHHFLTI